MFGIRRNHRSAWIGITVRHPSEPAFGIRRNPHRVVNGRGRIEREYALGSRRVDLLVIWQRQDLSESRFVVECKLVRDGRSHAHTVEKGLEQTAAYMDTCGASAGHLVVFDMREGRSWAERIYRKRRDWNGTPVTVWGA